MNETTDKKIYQSQIERYDILFLQKGSNWNYNTINTSSLRGTENAIYQLSLQLSKKYKVAVLTNGGIHHSLNENLVYDNIQRVNNYTNVSIVIHMAYPFTYEYFHKNTVHFIYIQHDITVSFIKKFYKNIDFLKKIIYKFIFVSDWQKNKYVECYDIEEYKCVVMQNAISPVLELPQQSINKKMTLVYASSPYRGLTIILPVFNKLLQHFPNLRLKIFSAFKIENKNKDYTPITDLNSYTLSTCIDSLYINYYNTFINHENIDYYGNVPQEILFKHMKESMILYYPNTFPETCCTTVLEALACRCIVVSSKLGALPQTTNNLSFLYDPQIKRTEGDFNVDNLMRNPVPVNEVSQEYYQNMFNKIQHILTNYDSDEYQSLLDKSYDYIQEKCLWKYKATHLENLFTSI